MPGSGLFQGLLKRIRCAGNLLARDDKKFVSKLRQQLISMRVQVPALYFQSRQVCTSYLKYSISRRISDALFHRNGSITSLTAGTPFWIAPQNKAPGRAPSVEPRPEPSAEKNPPLLREALERTFKSSAGIPRVRPRRLESMP